MLNVPSGLTTTGWPPTVTDWIPPASVAVPATLRVALLVYEPSVRAETIRVGFVVSVPGGQLIR